jgi:hypothetical protein
MSLNDVEYANICAVTVRNSEVKISTDKRKRKETNDDENEKRT